MGYTTEFTGSFTVEPPLSEAHATYIKQFGDTRRMKRDANVALTLPDPIRESVGLPVGKQGCYFVGGGGYAGQDRDKSIIDYNNPPDGQPGLWCQWVPTHDRDGIEWDGSEKFYYYVEWLKYLIQHFLKPWGYTVNGDVEWQGEEREDRGVLRVTDNIVKTGSLLVEYEFDE